MKDHIENNFMAEEIAISDEEEACRIPSGPVVIGLEELIRISEKRKEPRRVVERKIQITGRREKKFVPPSSSSRRFAQMPPRLCQTDEDFEGFVMEGSQLRENKGEARESKGRSSIRSKRSLLSGGDRKQNKAPVAVDEGVVEEFFWPIVVYSFGI